MNTYHCKAYRQADGKIVTTGILDGTKAAPVPEGELILEKSIQATGPFDAKRLFMEAVNEYERRTTRQGPDA